MSDLCHFFKTMHHSRLSYLIALLVGGISTLAFAPYHLWWVQVLTMGWLFYCTSTYSLRKVLLTGLSYGIGHALFGLYWLYVSMHTYGDMDSAMAGTALFLFSIVLGLFTLLATGSAHILNRHIKPPLCLFFIGILPATWALSDWLQGWVLTGFPWLTSGYAHSVGPFKGLAPILGVYGLSWLSGILAGAVAAIILTSNKVRIRLTAGMIVFMAVILMTRYISWTHPYDVPISVRLLQGNIAQETKFSRESIIAAMLRYQRMIEEKPADLIVIPETAIPIFPFQLPQDYMDSLDDYARKTQSHLALGMPYETPEDQVSNSLFVVDPNKSATLNNYNDLYRYDKHHLVPFGEFIPWGFKWFVNMMNIPLGDMGRGTAIQAPFAVNNQWIQPNICYEDLFGEEIAAQLSNEAAQHHPTATILLNISNVAWFGHTAVLPQHLQISQMRALETGRPMIRSTNTGTTAVIDPHGNIIKQLPVYTIGALSATVQGYQGMTPYIRWGNAGIVILAFLLLGSIYFYSRFIFNKRS